MKSKISHYIKRLLLKINHYKYSVPVLGCVIRHTLGRRQRFNLVCTIIHPENREQTLDLMKIALTAWALRRHPYKQVSMSTFAVSEWACGGNTVKLKVRIEVPSRKTLKAKDKNKES